MIDDDDSYAPEDQQEDIEDLSVKDKWFEDAVLWSADWTTETIIAQLRRGNINLNPNFQRRSAWNTARKSLFIESLILGLPIPQIILAEDKDAKGRFIVIDGKQRLLAIRQFAASKEDSFDQLVLKGLQDRPDLIGEDYESLKASTIFRKDVDRFENQTVRTVVIRGWKKEDYLYSVFLRINQGSVTLSTQELRQALHPGKFSIFIDKKSGNSKPLLEALGLTAPDFRMRDAELLLRFFAYKFFAPTYRGNLKQFLDEAHTYFNKQWREKEDVLNREFAEFEAALSFLREKFGHKDYLRKWNGRSFESRINRAVFDIMLYYFTDPNIRRAADPRMNEVKTEFKKLCVDPQFLSSIEATTKSKEANETRFRAFAERLSTITGLHLSSPFP